MTDNGSHLPAQNRFAAMRPAVSPEAPTAFEVTEYDRLHFSIYARLVFADDAGEDWRQSAAEILALDVEGGEEAAHRCWESHTKRAHWIATEGYQMLLVQAGLIQAQ